jgi:hypothetical protein
VVAVSLGSGRRTGQGRRWRVRRPPGRRPRAAPLRAGRAPVRCGWEMKTGPPPLRRTVERLWAKRARGRELRPDCCRHRSSHDGVDVSVAAVGVKHTLATGRPDDSFRRRTVVAARDRIGDEAMTRVAVDRRALGHDLDRALSRARRNTRDDVDPALRTQHGGSDGHRLVPPFGDYQVSEARARAFAFICSPMPERTRGLPRSQSRRRRRCRHRSTSEAVSTPAPNRRRALPKSNIGSHAPASSRRGCSVAIGHRELPCRFAAAHRRRSDAGTAAIAPRWMRSPARAASAPSRWRYPMSQRSSPLDAIPVAIASSASLTQCRPVAE